MRILLALVFVVTSACSFHGLGPPKRPDYGGPLECSEDIGVPIFDTTWALATLGVTAYIYEELKDKRDGSHASAEAAPFILASALGIISAGYGYVMVSRCKRAKALDVVRRAEAKQRRREHKEVLIHAWALTQQAAMAARSGDCETVAKLSPAVSALDEDFHATVFLGDVAIARCVAQPPAQPAQP